MSKRFPRAKWVLPDVVDPPGRLCFQIEVPDDPQHLAAFRGALWDLASATQWADDIAHTAKEVAAVWRNIYFNVKKCDGTPANLGGIEEDFELPLRVDCNCNVWVTCCDGTEKQILTAAEVQALILGTTPGNAPQPAAGQCQTYHNYVTGLGTELIPYPVSSGDTIEIQNIQGGTNGNNIARWNCGTGDEYFGGGCVGFPDYSGANRMPSVPTGTVIVNINGTWYDGRSIITVPGGVSLVQPVVALNYDPTYPASGTINYDAHVCNNGTATWSHTLDFALTNGGYTSLSSGASDPASWVSGLGWRYDTYVAANAFTLQKTIPSTVLTRATVYVTFAGSINGAGSVYADGSSVGIGGSTSGNQVFVIPLSGAQTDAALAITGVLASAGGSAVITKVVWEGNGTDPF